MGPSRFAFFGERLPVAPRRPSAVSRWPGSAAMSFHFPKMSSEPSSAVSNLSNRRAQGSFWHAQRLRMACVVAGLDLGRTPLNGRAVRWLFFFRQESRIAGSFRQACSQHHLSRSLWNTRRPQTPVVPRWLGDSSSQSKPSERRWQQWLCALSHTPRSLFWSLSRPLDYLARDATFLIDSLLTLFLRRQPQSVGRPRQHWRSVFECKFSPLHIPARCPRELPWPAHRLLIRREVTRWLLSGQLRATFSSPYPPSRHDFFIIALPAARLSCFRIRLLAGDSWRPIPLWSSSPTSFSFCHQ